MICEIFILGFIVVCVFMMLYYSSCGPRWKKGPKNEYKKLIKKLGKPYYVNNNPKGVAIWKKFASDSPFVRVMLIDETVIHYVPYKHYGFLYLTIKYEIDPRDLTILLSCSESFMYDKLKRELTVRSGSFEQGMTWLVLANDINTNKIAVEQIQDQIEIRMKRLYCDAEKNYNILQTIGDKYKMQDSDYSC